MTPPASLRRQLGLAAVAAIVMGNMLGSGVFFTPGELAAVAHRPWQVHFIWALSGLITLCGALTLAELCVLLPQAGASYHIIREGFGPFWGFLQVWLELWVTGPGAIAGIAIAFGEFIHRAGGGWQGIPPVGWGIAAIGFFAAVNLAGVEWGGRTQIALTAIKVAGIAGLVVGGLFLAAPAAPVVTAVAAPTGGLLGFAQFTGLGIAAVLFTYDGWIDVSHVAGEVRNPGRAFPRGLGLGVAALTLLYVVINVAYLRVVPLEAMRAAPTAVATTVAEAAFGPRGATLLNGLMVVSIFGALGGLVMTLPRLFYTLADAHVDSSTGPARRFFAALRRLSPRTAVPSGAIAFTALVSIAALLFFGSFSRLVNFLVVPLQLANILMVGAVFRLRRRHGPPAGYRTPGYPVTPIVFIVVMAGFLISAIRFQPVDTLIGVALAATGVPVYFRLRRRDRG
ncbi:MAG: APC family permease [Gemmatimonadales bacterium]